MWAAAATVVLIAATVSLASCSAASGREGLVQDQTTKPGRAAVLLDGDTKTTSISTTNLRKASGL